MAAASSFHPLPLLPSHRYELAVQAFNAVGGGPLSASLIVETPKSPFADFELPLAAWRRGTLGRGGSARHRVFLPSSLSRCRVVLQQVHASGCCTTLEAVARALSVLERSPEVENALLKPLVKLVSIQKRYSPAVAMRIDGENGISYKATRQQRLGL